MCGRARCTLRVEDAGRAAGYRNPLRSVNADRFLVLDDVSLIPIIGETEKLIRVPTNCMAVSVVEYVVVFSTFSRYRPSYNIAPGGYMPVVRHMQIGEATEQVSSEPVVHCMKWGLVPSYTKRNEAPDHYRMFNARSESVHLKPTFSRLLKRNRCVVTAEGFYEWKKDGSKKQPYYLHFKDGRPLVFAGLYDSWKDEEENVLHTFTILTTRNSKAIGWLHDRMPVILADEAAVHSWLNDELTEASIHKLTLPYEASDLVWYPVTPEVGRPSFDVPECVREIKPKSAKESPIFQLLGKRKNIERSSTQDSEEPGSQISDIREHQLSDKGSAAYAVLKDEDLESEEDRKALLAGMEPDQDVTQALHKKETNEGGNEPVEDNRLQRLNPACNSAVKEEEDREDFAVKREQPAEEGLAVKEEISEEDWGVKRGSPEVGSAGKQESSEEDVAVKSEAPEECLAVTEGGQVSEKDFAAEKGIHEEHVSGKEPARDHGHATKKQTADEDAEEKKPGEESTRYEPEAKKRHVFVPPKGTTKKTSGRGTDKTSLPDKQKSLHVFFGKK